jgi:Lon protease-like protein
MEAWLEKRYSIPMKESSWLPLFPLGVVLLPGNLLPLHIFEQRYKTLIGECLQSESPFGVLLYDGSRLASAGCTATIDEVRKRYPDGRLDIVTRGQQRFAVLETDQRRPYLRCRCRFFDDQPEELGEAEAELARRGLELLAELELLADLEPLAALDESAGGGAEDLREISFRMAAAEGFSLEEKQAFLEMTSTRQRLQKAAAALGQLSERQKLTRQIREIIGGNGHPPSILKG